MIIKYFSEKQIYAATALGGPIPPGILIYKNFKRIGEEKKATISLLITFAFTFVLFYGLVHLPDPVIDKIPSIAFTSLYTGIVYLIYHKFLAREINEKMVEPENKASNWKVAGITLVGFVFNLVIIFAFAFSEPAFPGEKFEYGRVKHEIYFDKGTINVSDIQTIGIVLTQAGYFDDEVKQAVRIDKNVDEYLLNIPIQKDIWEDTQILLELNKLKTSLNNMTSKKFSLLLIHYDLSGKTQTKKI